MPNLNGTLLPFYKLLKFNAEFFINDEHVKVLEKLQEKLLTATKMTLRLAKPNQQYVVLTDASYYQAGFVLMIEDYVKNENTGKATKIYAPVSFGSKLFNAAQLKLSIFCKEFLAVYFALEHFAQYIWGCEKPVLVFTDNRSLTKFFQAETVPPALWNFLDRVLSFNIVVGHITGAANAAADFLSRMNNDPNETITLKITDRIPVKELEVSMTAKTPDLFISELDHSQTTEQSDVIEIVIKTLQAVNKQELVSQLSDLHKKTANIQEVVKYKLKIEKNLKRFTNA